jgi:hypothetical protein
VALTYGDERGSILIVIDGGGGEVADGLDPIQHPIDPSAAVRGGLDAMALLVLRSAVPALLLAGLSYAWVVSETRFEAIPQVTTPGLAVQVLLSPYALIAIALILRFLVGIAALVLAYPLSRQLPLPGSAGGDGSCPGQVQCSWSLTSSCSSRWSSSCI